jgi:transposase
MAYKRYRVTTHRTRARLTSYDALMRDLVRMSRGMVLSDEVWARIEPLLPARQGPMVPPEFGAWQTVHRRHLRWSADGTWDRVLAALQTAADAEGGIDWRVSVDSTIARVHQHGATARRSTSVPSSHTGGGVE